MARLPTRPTNQPTTRQPDIQLFWPEKYPRYYVTQWCGYGSMLLVYPISVLIYCSQASRGMALVLVLILLTLLILIVLATLACSSACPVQVLVLVLELVLVLVLVLTCH